MGVTGVAFGVGSLGTPDSSGKGESAPRREVVLPLSDVTWTLYRWSVAGGRRVDGPAASFSKSSTSGFVNLLPFWSTTAVFTLVMATGGACSLLEKLSLLSLLSELPLRLWVVMVVVVVALIQGFNGCSLERRTHFFG